MLSTTFELEKKLKIAREECWLKINLKYAFLTSAYMFYIELNEIKKKVSISETNFQSEFRVQGYNLKDIFFK